MLTEGLRKFKSASLRVAVPLGLPETMHEGISELIDIHSGNHRKGHATGLLKSVCAEADQAHQVLMVQVLKFDDGMSTEILEKWYSRHGFVNVQMLDDQGRPAILMARQPNDR